MIRKTDLKSIYGFNREAVARIGLPDKTCCTVNGGYTAKLYSYQRVIDFVTLHPEFNWDVDTLDKLERAKLDEESDRDKWLSEKAINEAFSMIKFHDPLPEFEEAVRAASVTGQANSYYFDDYISAGVLYEHIKVSYSNYRLVMNSFKKKITRSYMFYELKYILRNRVKLYIASLYPPPDSNGRFTKPTSYRNK